IVLREFQEVRRFLEAYRLLLLGTVTGILDIRQGSTDRLSWSMLDLERRPPQPIELGPELFALNTLQQQAAVAKKVDARLRSGVEHLPPPRLIELSRVLLANLEVDGSFPSRWRYRGAQAEEVVSHGAHILNEAVAWIDGLLASTYEPELRDRVMAECDLAAVSRTIAWQEPPLRLLREPVPNGRSDRG